jgi:hypothetical protein
MIPRKMLMRSAALAALERPGATMAGKSVYDSRLLPVVDISSENLLPAILIYTDTDKRVNQTKTGSSILWKRDVTLVLDIAITREFKYIETDPELEALLDLFEAEVELALFSQDPLAKAFREVCQTIDEVEITAYRDAEQARSYAVRQMVISCSMTRSPLGCVEGQATLPPHLAELAEQIATEPVFASTRALLAGAPIVRGPPLKVGFRADFIDPADPNRLPPGQTKGPDGRIEAEFSTESEP